MTVCSECGRPVGRYLTLMGEGWMHQLAEDAADCANARGDRSWQPVELHRLMEEEGGTA